MLTLHNVSCGYGHHRVVQEMNLTVENGKKLCILGPNGCGKSTLLKAIVGLIAHSGDIAIDGVNIQKMSRKAVAGQIAFMSQMSTVYFSYTVFETVMLGRYSKMEGGVFAGPSERDIEAVCAAIEAVDILHLKDRVITDLSGGELQRVFLAKVFAQNPNIILLDEPTNHLDLKHQIELIQYLKQWAEGHQKIVIAVLHDINLALSFADEILLLSDGCKVVCDTRDNIVKSKQINEVYGLNVKEYMRNAYGQWAVQE